MKVRHNSPDEVIVNVRYSNTYVTQHGCVFDGLGPFVWNALPFQNTSQSMAKENRHFSVHIYSFNYPFKQGGFWC